MWNYSFIICCTIAIALMTMHLACCEMISRFVEVFLPLAVYFVIVWATTNIKIHVTFVCSGKCFCFSEGASYAFTSEQMKIKLLWKYFTKFIVNGLFWVYCYNNWNSRIKEYFTYFFTKTCANKCNFDLCISGDNLL